MRKNKWFIFMVFALAFSMALMGCSNATNSDPGNENSTEGSSSDNKSEVVKLKAISFVASNHALTKDIVPLWIEMIESEMDNVEIEWVGGPESIPTPDQFSAVQSGIVDIGFNVSPYSVNDVPAAESMALSPFTPAEERENGYFDYLTEKYKSAGVTYLGRWVSGSSFYVFSNNEINKISDFEGLRMRSNPVYHRVFQELGAVPIDVPPADVYTALERNMVDAFAFTILGPREDGWTEVTRYLLNEPFLNQQAAFFMNSERWDAFSPEDQEKFLRISKEFEQKAYDYFTEKNIEEFERLNELDIKEIKLSEEESEIFQETTQRVKWAEMDELVPDEVERMKSLLMK